MNKPLHWSFDGARREQPEFPSVLVEALRSHYDDGDSTATDRLFYRQISNFGRGFQRGGSSLDTGSLAIAVDRSAGEPMRYIVSSESLVSGEKREARFTTLTDDVRSIIGEWRVEISCTGAGEYTGVDLHGVIKGLDEGAGRDVRSDTGGRCVRIDYNGLAGSVQCLEPDQRLTPSYALFGHFPAEAVDSITLLSELESIHTGVCIKPIGAIDLDPAGTLQGFCIAGDGVVPTYWWIDEAGRAAIVSSTLTTLVIASPSAQDGAG